MHRDTHGFNEALRSALREDPILSSWVRCVTLKPFVWRSLLLKRVALGLGAYHLCGKTIDRVIDVFPAEEKDMVRAMLSESLYKSRDFSNPYSRKKWRWPFAAHEIMIGIPAIRNLIRENKVAQMYSAIQTGAKLRYDHTGSKV